ncbi:MAG TPA: hypothetical protein VMV69_17585 [Pirellulales bacterium]|nr:hypothetical protein [Pirellulales bacterium]
MFPLIDTAWKTDAKVSSVRRRRPRRKKNASANGTDTSTSGALTESGTSTEDATGASKGTHTEQSSDSTPSSSQSHSASASSGESDKAHAVDNFSETNGAVNSDVTQYTDDNIAKTNGQQIDTSNGQAGPGVSQSQSASSSYSTSAHYDDNGSRNQAAGASSDVGTANLNEQALNTSSNQTTETLSGPAGNGSVSQSASASATSTMVENGSYDNSAPAGVAATDSEHDVFNSNNQSTNTAVNTSNVSPAGDPGTSISTSYSDSASGKQTDNGTRDQTNGVTTAETDNFTNDATDQTSSSFHETSDTPNAVVPGDTGVALSAMAPLSVMSPLFMLFPTGAAMPSVTGSSTADAGGASTEKGHETGVTTIASGSTNTDANFTDKNTSNDSASQSSTSNGSYSVPGASGDFSEGRSASASDSETYNGGGTIDLGVTTGNYTDSGGESASASASFSSDGTATSGGITVSGQGKDTAVDGKNVSFTVTGEYTTSAPASATSSTTSATTSTTTTPSPTMMMDDPNGDAIFQQTVNDNLSTSGAQTSQWTGTESGPNFATSGSATNTASASASVVSDATVDVNLAANTDAQSGTYSDQASGSEQSSCQENGWVVYPGAFSETWNMSFSMGGSEIANDSGTYGTPGGGTITTTTSWFSAAGGSGTITYYMGGSVSWSGGSSTSSGPTTTSGPDGGQPLMVAPAPTGPSATQVADQPQTLEPSDGVTEFVVTVVPTCSGPPATPAKPAPNGEGHTFVYGFTGRKDTPGLPNDGGEPSFTDSVNNKAKKNGLFANIDEEAAKLQKGGPKAGTERAFEWNVTKDALEAQFRQDLAAELGYENFGELKDAALRNDEKGAALRKKLEGYTVRFGLVGYSFGGAGAVDAADVLPGIIQDVNTELQLKIGLIHEFHLYTVDAGEPKPLVNGVPTGKGPLERGPVTPPKHFVNRWAPDGGMGGKILGAVDIEIRNVDHLAVDDKVLRSRAFAKRLAELELKPYD